MNKEVKDLIQPYNPNIKKGTWYVTSGTRDVKKPYLLARLEELEAENKLLKEKVNQLENKYSKALELLVDFNLPCEQRMFMDRYSEWCELNCSVSDECYKKCWNKYIESELEKSKSE